MSSSPPAPVRVALVAPAGDWTVHLAHLAGSLARDSRLRVVALILPTARHRRPGSQRIGAIVRDAVLRVDRRVFRPWDDAFAVEQPAFGPGVTRVRVDETGPVDAGAALTGLELDLIVDPGTWPVPAALTAAARLGRVELTPERGGWPAAAWDMRAGRSTTPAVVRHVTADGTTRVLANVEVPCSPHSLARTQSAVRWQSTHLALRLIDRIAAGDADGDAVPAAPRTSPTTGQPAPTGGPLEQPSRTPGSPPSPLGLPATLALFGRLGARLVRRAIGGVVYAEEWFVAVRPAGTGPLPGTLAGFSPVPTAPGTFLADPHLAEDTAGPVLFAEELDSAVGYGRIAALLRSEDGRPGPPTIVLDTGDHRSYPCIFRWRETWYMIPESWASGSVELYRATSFPEHWVRHAVILPGVQAVDPTIHVADDRLWLFLVLGVRGVEPMVELSLFHAPDVDGPWTAHPGNPIVADPGRARPAGRLIQHDGMLIRPGQDCRGSYGRRIVLNRVDRLDPMGYQETPVGSIEPSGLPGVVRTHCYARATDWEAIDGRRRTLRLARGRR